MAPDKDCYRMTNTMRRMYLDAQFGGSSSVFAYVEMIGLMVMIKKLTNRLQSY